MTMPDKSVTGKQPDIKQEMERLAKKPRTHEQTNFTNLEELQDLAEPILPRMVSTLPFFLMLPAGSLVLCHKSDLHLSVPVCSVLSSYPSGLRIVLRLLQQCRQCLTVTALLKPCLLLALLASWFRGSLITDPPLLCWCHRGRGHPTRQQGSMGSVPLAAYNDEGCV